MTDYQLNNIDPDDIGELLLRVEKSFGIKFTDSELSHITTFGEFCDHIANKIDLESVEDCTTQQAFYKLRQSIANLLEFDIKELTPKTETAKILPRPTRIARVKRLEEHLGFKLNVLRPKHSISCTLILILLTSLVMLFFQWKAGLLGLAFSMMGFWLATKTGKELDLQNLGQVAAKMARENYLNSRRNVKTFNRKEIARILTDWFSDEFDLEKTELTRDAKFV